jgi:hypothetical protein
MKLWYRFGAPRAGETVRVEVACIEGLTHISVIIKSTSGETVARTYQGHREVGDPLYHVWQWLTDNSLSAGIYWVDVTVAGEKIGQCGFLVRGEDEPPPAPPPPPPLPPLPPLPLPDDYTLRGVHDRAGGYWLKSEGLTGWCLIPVYVGEDTQDLRLQELADAGIRVVVNLRYSYAVDDGGRGTMPAPQTLTRYEQACIETMTRNPQAHAFVYCNEMNNPREHPAGFELTPDYYLQSYNRVWASKPAGARMGPGSIDPFNAASPAWADWRVAWRAVLDGLVGADLLALHTYTHGPGLDLIWGYRQFGHAPLLGVYYDLRVLQSQQEITPLRFAHLPQIVTECNHFTRTDGQIGWEAGAGEWVREAYAYCRAQGVAGVCLFRYAYQDWRFGNLPDILQALREITP